MREKCWQQKHLKLDLAEKLKIFFKFIFVDVDDLPQKYQDIKHVFLFPFILKELSVMLRT